MPVGPGPNPVKVAMALEHLGLDYDCVPLEFGEGKGTVKDPEYTSKVNPNGRYLAEKVPIHCTPSL
jgi:glutathione S-transferase